MSQNTVFIQKSELLNGVLRYSSLTPLDKKYIDPYGTLRNRDRLVEFHDQLESEGYILKFQDNESVPQEIIRR